MKRVLISAVAVAGFAVAMTCAASAQSYMSDARIKDCIDTTYSAGSRIKACDKAIVSLTDPDDHHVLGWALLYRSDSNSSLGKFQEAIIDADKAAAVFPGERHILNAQCWPRAVLNKEIEKAREACDASLDQNPDDPSVMDSAGLVALRQGRWEDAAKHYSKAYSYDNGMTGSLFGIALSAYAQGKTENGDTILKTVKARKPEVIEEYKSYGLTVEDMKARAAKAN